MNSNFKKDCIMQNGHIKNYDATIRVKKYHTDMMNNLFPQLKQEK